MSDVAPIVPVHVTIADADLVTIPVWHYAALLACQRLVAAGAVATPTPTPTHPALACIDPRSRLFGDPEVSVFLYEAFGRMKLKDAFTACRERFGTKRCPSRATIARYWTRQR